MHCSKCITCSQLQWYCNNIIGGSIFKISCSTIHQYFAWKWKYLVRNRHFAFSWYIGAVVVQRTRQYFDTAKINQGGHDKGLWSITGWPPDSVCWLVGVSWVSMGAVLGRVPRAGAGGARGQVSRCSGRHAVPRLTGPLASGGSGHSAALEPPTASHQPPSSDTRPLINRQLRPADLQS